MPPNAEEPIILPVAQRSFHVSFAREQGMTGGEGNDIGGIELEFEGQLQEVGDERYRLTYEGRLMLFDETEGLAEAPRRERLETSFTFSGGIVLAPGQEKTLFQTGPHALRIALHPQE